MLLETLEHDCSLQPITSLLAFKWASVASIPQSLTEDHEHHFQADSDGICYMANRLTGVYTSNVLCLVKAVDTAILEEMRLFQSSSWESFRLI